MVGVSTAVSMFDKLLSCEVVLLLRRHSCVLVDFVCIIHLTAIAHVIDPMFDLCPDMKRERESQFLDQFRHSTAASSLLFDYV